MKTNTFFRYFLLSLSVAAIATSIVYLEEVKAPSPSGELEFVNPSAFINTDPFTLSDVIGEKVILVDFWTYSCINCQRTFPYLNEWQKKYADQGLLIVGVHTPEFEFEKIQSNVEAAVEQFGIEYPVVMDNDQGTWNAFANRYWPHEYLIDLNGKIIYDHIGEGNYDESEAEIQKALGLTNMGMSTPEGVIAIDYDKIKSPETYFGSARGENLHFLNTTPAELTKNEAYLIGDWTQKEERTESGAKSELLFNYDAKNVYLVASADTPVELEVWVDGSYLKTITIEANKLYPLVEGADYGAHKLKLVPKNSGLKIFTFTFG